MAGIRVVVTGLGAVSSLGANVASTLEAIQSGACGLASLPAEEWSAVDCKVGAPIHSSFDLKTAARRMPVKNPAAAYAYAASKEALEDANLHFLTYEESTQCG